MNHAVNCVWAEKSMHSVTMIFLSNRQIATAHCYVYDPRFTKEEKQMLTSLGFIVILQNEVRICVNVVCEIVNPFASGVLYF